MPGHIFSGTIGTILLILAIASFGVLPVRLIGIAPADRGGRCSFVVELNAPGSRDLGRARHWSSCCSAGGSCTTAPAASRCRRSCSVGVAVVRRRCSSGSCVAKVLAIRHMPPAQGAETIVGQEGVALGAGSTPDGIVRVASEEWRAVAPRRPIAGGREGPRHRGSTGSCSPSSRSTTSTRPAGPDAGTRKEEPPMNMNPALIALVVVVVAGRARPLAKAIKVVPRVPAPRGVPARTPASARRARGS